MVTIRIDNISKKRGSKIAVLIHGYPVSVSKDDPLYKYFDSRGYSIIALLLFNPDFKLTKEEVKADIERQLNGRKPEVIVGICFGALLAPFLAKTFPKAKLVLIAPAPFMKTKISSLNRLLALGETSALLSPIQWIIGHTPIWLYALVYKMFIPPVTSTEEKRLLEEHIKQNWGYLRDIPPSENREVLDFIATTDNSVLLRSLTNKTLIFAQEGDTLLPFGLSLEVKNLIKGSILIKTTKRLHYAVFDESNYKQLDDFLNNS